MRNQVKYRRGKTARFMLALVAAHGAILARSAFGAGGAAESSAPAPKKTEVQATMDSVLSAFRELQKYLISSEKFESPANDAQIRTLLDTLGSGFHKVSMATSPYKDEPGFAGTLTLLNDLLADSRSRFEEGNKGYVLWRLRNSVDYCVTCHTRHEVKIDFLSPPLDFESLTIYQRAEFLLATRQFEAAGAAFLAAARHPPEGRLRIEALRRWLLIYTRVHPEPRKALEDLTRFEREVPLTKPEADEVNGWIDSLRRWNSESKRIEITPIRRAEHLIQQALALKDPMSGRNGTVELFRATGLLHQILEDGRPEVLEQRARALRLLGVAYSEVPFVFVSDLPALFLEECIREYPDTDDARKAFQLYQHLVTLDYTGSGGVRLPSDIEVNLRELYDLAYKSPGETQFNAAPGKL